jgi:probable HAF family extracellular repeat protein
VERSALVPLLTCLTGLAVIPSAETAAAQAMFSGLGDLPGGAFDSVANAVSADGLVIVGEGSSASGSEAFRWEGGVMTGLGDLPGGEFESIARAVSADGQIVVGSGRGTSGLEAFRWENGTMAGLGDLPGGDFLSRANGVSADGSVIVGIGSSPTGFEAVRWSGGSIEGLGDLAGGPIGSSQAMGVSGDGEVIAGYGNSGDFQAAVWEDDAIVGLGFLADPGPTGAFQSLAYGVSANGSVTVGASDNWRNVFDPYTGGCLKVKYFEPFRFQDGVMASLFEGITPCQTTGTGSTFGISLAVNADGSVIVGWGFGAFIWDESKGKRDLEDVLENDFGLDLTGWRLDRATGVSADGTVIVGYGRNPQGDQEAWIAVLPQPDPVPGLSASGLMVVAVCFVGTAVWAIRHRASPG